ncbi:MAG: HlyC/CorC family transporter [Gemmatimonadetes bacterium]|nr:HlyC/CorC family transporter [Gemmatimonadota bacterium]
MTPLTAGVVAAVFILASALLSAAETAVFSVSRSRLRTLVDEGFQGADELARIRARSTSIQTAVHLLITILNLVAVGLAATAGALTAGAAGALGALAAAVAVLLVFAEIAPRALAFRRPIRMALASAPGLARLERIMGALLSPFIRLEALLSGLHGEDDELDEREMRDLTQLGRKEGVVDSEEHALVERAFRLDERTAWDVMTPRVDVFAWSEDRTLDSIVPELEGVPYSRVPVYGESVDDITGILYVREAYQTWASGDVDVTLGSLAREPYFVPGSLSLSQLLRSFQARRLHMGIVADEFGGTDGLVTLEDVLEELVGEIVDETDVPDEELLRIGENDLVADGGVDLRDINESFGLALPEEENRSLNGFILEELGYVPLTGETLDVDGARVEVLEATETQVVRARVTRISSTDDRDG